MKREALYIHKRYLYGNEEDGGYYKFYVDRFRISNNEMKNYELGTTLLDNGKYITYGVKNNSYFVDYYNQLCSHLLDVDIYGNCYLIFDREFYDDDEYNDGMRWIKTKLIDAGLKSEQINY